ncbi:proline racemase family protein [Sporosarcina sp. HYO08]|uniref:proline racemase family protein n=1 Tax=Sporosarcina sp. HYO08 TaxID=1759557 RepID=UPI00079A9A27|nr:proline racemase family protein [Sporosarcina sp. HYO08]KXH80715.1 hypothetical protein AU377_08185 [Sporosarcina sp. HYO08]
MNFEKMFCTIDTHVAGEAFRIVIQSPIAFQGGDVKSNDKVLQSNFTNEKNLLLNEPRGHRGIHGCVIAPTENADFQLLFFNHDEVCNFKYEGLITTITALLETGNLPKKSDDLYEIETVHGIYTVKAPLTNGEVTSVYLESESCKEVNANPDYTTVQIDSTRNYLLVPLPEEISSLELGNLAAISNWGLAKTAELKRANVEFEGVVLIESNEATPGSVRSVTFEKDGFILRSPGIDSSFAILCTSNAGDELHNESIFGSALTVKKLSQANNEYRFSVEAEAFVTGSHEFIFDQEDPLKNGFLLV